MKYLITGGTGSFGKHYVKWLTENTDSEIVVFSRGELKQWEMKKEFPDVEYIIGDIRETDSICDAVKGCSYIIHTAALKHVATGEDQPWETIKTNIEGTQYVIDAVNKYATIGAKMVMLSTDKAVLPINLYGASKMVAEKLTIKGGHVVTRWGNVFGSNGSILHIFKKQCAIDDRFTITDKRMTRFIITFDECIEIVNEALQAESGSILLPRKLHAISIIDLAYAFDDKATFTEIGIQPGEKLSEVLEIEPYICSADYEKMTIEEIKELINGSL